jgi:hypothetical protein
VRDLPGANWRGADPERATAEAIRRARAKIRRYDVADRLNRLATLTYRFAFVAVMEVRIPPRVPSPRPQPNPDALSKDDGDNAEAEQDR